MGRDASPDRVIGRGEIIAVAVIACIAAVGAGGFWLGREQSVPTTPERTSVEAGFARDMQVHHIQGVEMAMIVRDRTDDPAIRQLAYDVATTQGHQAGQLYGWLAAWGHNQLGREPPMTWMGHSGHGMGTLMPGMAPPMEMTELSASSGVEAERRFLTLMIAHHRGALDMSAAVLERSSHPVVTAFARSVLASQQSEIDLMTKLLEERKAR